MESQIHEGKALMHKLFTEIYLMFLARRKFTVLPQLKEGRFLSGPATAQKQPSHLETATTQPM